MNTLYTLEDLDPAGLSGRRVLARVDFNVPLEEGRVMDTTRLEAALPTLEELLAAGARLVLMSHCGRPKGSPDPAFSLRPVAAELGRLLGAPVAFATDCVGEPARETIEALAPGQCCLLENLRFHAGEKDNDPAFADELAALADAYVDDAFGTAHRAHASVVGVPERMTDKAAGRLLVREVEALGLLLGEPQRPFAAVVGGAKIEGKAETLANLLPRLDLLALGGAMANTFLAALGYEMQRSLVERERIEMAASILRTAEEQGLEIVLPHQLVVTDDLASPGRVETVAVDQLPEGSMAVDVGPAFGERVAVALSEAGTVFWNGPMGVFEKPPFDEGTMAVARAVADCRGYTVVGGGETVAAVHRAGLAGSISHVSTGGGASLELLAGKTLPGVAALEKAG